MEADPKSTQKSSKSDSASWLEDSTPQSDVDPFWQAACATSERLEIISRIGKGGMAVVYKARHLVMNKEVAVKLLLPHLTNDSTSLKRFQQEAQATATLNHANIVRIHDCGLSNGQAFIIMDFVEGQSLEEIIRTEGKFRPERALEVFVQICEALHHAHERGIIHRDLKPSNVMLTTDKNGFDIVKVVDFGIAKLLMNDDGQTMHNLTQTGDVFGSPLYMSPEQCSGQKLDTRSDIYSLGCLMYEALTGEPPIVGKNFLDTMQKHLTDLPQPFNSELVKSPLAKRMQVIVFTCMAKEPSARYSSMKAIAHDLRQAITGKNTTGMWKEREKTVSQIVNKASAKKLLIQKVILTVTGALILAGSYSLATEINQPSGFENKPLFEVIELDVPKVSAQYDKDLVRMYQDIQSMRSSSPSDIEEIQNGQLLGNFYADNGKWKEAIIEYTNLCKLDAGTVKLAEFHKSIGYFNLRSNNFPEAKKHFYRFLDTIITSLNSIEDRERTNHNVLKMLDGVIYGINTKNIRLVLTYLGYIAEQEGQLDVAENYAQLMVASDDDYAKSEHLKDLAEKKGEKDPHGSGILPPFPGDLKGDQAKDLAYLADIIRLRKNPAAAEDFKSIIEIREQWSYPDRDARLALALSLSYFQDGKYNEAVAALDEAHKSGASDKQLGKAINQEYCRALWKNGMYFQSVLEKLKTFGQ